MTLLAVIIFGFISGVVLFSALVWGLGLAGVFSTAIGRLSLSQRRWPRPSPSAAVAGEMQHGNSWQRFFGCFDDVSKFSEFQSGVLTGNPKTP
jgi:hypothetical protein